MRTRDLWILPLVLLCFTAGGKKTPETTVRFHTEANPRDGESFAVKVNLQNPPREAFIGKLADISEREITAIWPFDAGDGTFGCGFKLDNHGRMGLSVLSTQRRSQSLVVLVNGRQVIDMKIDAPVNDGVLTIQRGLTGEELEGFYRKWVVVGETKKRKIPKKTE